MPKTTYYYSKLKAVVNVWKQLSIKNGLKVEQAVVICFA